MHSRIKCDTCPQGANKWDGDKNLINAIMRMVLLVGPWRPHVVPDTSLIFPMPIVPQALNVLLTKPFNGSPCYTGDTRSTVVMSNDKNDSASARVGVTSMCPSLIASWKRPYYPSFTDEKLNLRNVKIVRSAGEKLGDRSLNHVPFCIDALWLWKTAWAAKILFWFF
jgi:hypothetical protein